MAIVYPIFPRRLTIGELSAATRIVHGNFKWKRDALVDSFDDGMWESSRPRGSGKLLDTLIDNYVVPQGDYAIIATFLDTVEFTVKPFQYVHSFMGTMLVKLSVSPQFDFFVDGRVTWFTFPLQLRGVSG